MAARTSTPNLRQQEQTRAAIKTTQLVKRLQCFALGENDDAGNVVDLDASKLKAIEVLLRKTLPDLSAVTLSGDEDNPVNMVHRIERVIVDTANRDGSRIPPAS
jgi:hypothetical protein